MIPSPGTASDRQKFLRGLYLILDEGWVSRACLEDVLQEAVDVGVRMVQYRCKTCSMKEAYARGKVLRDLTPRDRMLLIVNDRCDLALAVEADGVHLGQQDLSVTLAKRLLGGQLLVGLSTHTAEQVLAANRVSPDYLGFGPIFSTATKLNHDPVVGVEGLRQIRSLTALPIFAIGGITASAVPELREAGANGVAVASGVLGATHRKNAFHQFMDPFQVES